MQNRKVLPRAGYVLLGVTQTVALALSIVNFANQVNIAKWGSQSASFAILESMLFMTGCTSALSAHWGKSPPSKGHGNAKTARWVNFRALNAHLVRSAPKEDLHLKLAHQDVSSVPKGSIRGEVNSGVRIVSLANTSISRLRVLVLGAKWASLLIKMAQSNALHVTEASI